MSLHESVQYQAIFNQANFLLYALYWTIKYIEYILICRYTFIRTQRRHHPTSCRNSTLVKSQDRSIHLIHGRVSSQLSQGPGFLQFTSRRTSSLTKATKCSFFRFPRKKVRLLYPKKDLDETALRSSYLPKYRKVSWFHPVVCGFLKIPIKGFGRENMTILYSGIFRGSNFRHSLIPVAVEEHPDLSSHVHWHTAKSPRILNLFVSAIIYRWKDTRRDAEEFSITGDVNPEW